MLDKNMNAWHFKLLSVIYFQNMCIVTCDFYLKKIAHCFAFKTVLVLRFRYLVIRDIQLSHQLYNNYNIPDCGLHNGTKLSNSMSNC